MSLRWSAWILLIGAVLDFINSMLMNIIPSPAGSNGPPPTALAIGGILTSLLLLLGLPALYAALSKQARILSLVGVIGAVIVFLALITLYGMALPSLLSNSITSQGNASNPPPAILALLLISSGAGLIALLCLGIAVLRTTVFPRFIGVFFLIALLNVAGFFLMGVPDWLSISIGIVGTLALDGAWFFCGLTLVRREAVAEVAPSEPVAL